MTKTVSITKPEASAGELEAALTELFRDMDRRLKRIRKRDVEIAKLRDSTQASLERMKSW